MKHSIFNYYKTLAELTGDVKFETLAVFEMGQEKLGQFKKDYPLLSKHIEALMPMTDGIPWLKPLKDVHQAISQYLNNHLQLSKGIHLLPAEGWYFSMEFIDALKIANLDEYLQKNPIGFEKDVVDTFNTQMPAIENKLTQAFPKRVNLIRNIFGLHASENYEAAILMALAQADGMCKDVFWVKGKNGKSVRVGFFDMTRSKSEIRAQKLSQSFENVPPTSIFNVLCNQLARMDRNSSLVLEGNTVRLSDLNRHSIMHGETTDYGTKVNSIKAILLLDFIEDLHIIDNIQKAKAK